MEVGLLYIFIAISAVIAYRKRHTRELGVLISQQGRKDVFVIGNHLHSETSIYNGLELTLPYTLVNFYLDSHKDSKRRGPAALYDQNQRISLEGDFNKYFQLFVPKENAVLALSVLSPDVMQTLINSSQRYDVELSGNHLRIISLDKVSKLTGDPLIRAADKIVAELDHRAKSWKQTDAPAKLLHKKGSTFKLAGRYLRRSRFFVSIITMLITILAVGFGLAFYYTSQDPLFNDPYSKGLFQGTMMYAAAAIFIAAVPVAMITPVIWFFTNPSSKDLFE
ncbi:MAG: hypothetical protein M3Q70_03890 [bacterium]|nr:hypothetical protein [bacterium]